MRAGLAMARVACLMGTQQPLSARLHPITDQCHRSKRVTAVAYRPARPLPRVSKLFGLRRRPILRELADRLVHASSRARQSHSVAGAVGPRSRAIRTSPMCSTLPVRQGTPCGLTFCLGSASVSLIYDSQSISRKPGASGARPRHGCGIMCTAGAAVCASCVLIHAPKTCNLRSTRALPNTLPPLRSVVHGVMCDGS